MQCAYTRLLRGYTRALRDHRIVLDDGTYDAFIVWAEEADDDDTRVSFELAITTGTHKGEVVNITATRFTTRDPIDLIGLPCTLEVHNGVPRIVP